MTPVQIFKETALPGTLESHAIYLIAPPSNPTALEIYTVNAAGDVARGTMTEAQVQALIDASSGGGGSVNVVADIAERDGLTLDSDALVVVRDASADATVSSGSALYSYRHSDTSWNKESEFESLDVSLAWGNIMGRPSSSPAQIDAAVTASHGHSNKSQIDKVGEDADGNFTYDGELPVIGWASENW